MVVVTRVGQLQEWLQGVLHFSRNKSLLSQILQSDWLMNALVSE